MLEIIGKVRRRFLATDLDLGGPDSGSGADLRGGMDGSAFEGRRYGAVFGWKILVATDRPERGNAPGDLNTRT